jgi:polyphosphate glucokinase
VHDPDAGRAPEYVTIPASSAVLEGRAVGLDIGGTGIKAAVVDLATGELVTARVREVTPQPATPVAVMDVVARVFRGLQETGALTPDLPAGAGFPSVIRAGHSMTVVHGDASWVDVDVRGLLAERLDRPFAVLNDADAAGVAELAYGAGKGETGTVLLLDLGTGIGTSLFAGGQLVPNIQLGHLELDGRDAEARLSPVARKRRGIGLREWATEFSVLLARYEAYLSPDLVIFGGGMAKDYPRFASHLRSRARLVPDMLGTNAGIVGAARVGSVVSVDSAT